MVRVPVSQIQQFNNLFEQLILDRNTINLQLQQFKNTISLMSQRMTQMEQSNTQLKKWYDRASVEGLLNVWEQPLTNLVSSLNNSQNLSQNSSWQNKSSDRFDNLEMDRYSDVHLICQEQIETIVQLQEVATDIELGLQEIAQAVRNLNYTTKSMQGNVTRTQMLPFAEVVKRFPRVIRDLNLQFNKQVDLQIIGENTLLDRSVITELINFIFEPGFSTAQKVTELSGRGVGMDVVRTNLEEMGGNVRVSSELGKGTTFTLKIPFTLSILKVAVLEREGIIFAIPASSIRELLPLTSTNIVNTEALLYLLWQGTEIPLVEIEKTLVYRRSHQTVNLTGTPAIDRILALVVGDRKSFTALKLSRFWYEQESTIRAIDSPIPLPPGVISSVVFGDGKVIPLVDPFLLAEECLKEQLQSDRHLKIPVETHKQFTTTTILVVDDSINVRRYLSLTLEKVGYRVEQAKDGREAVEKLLGGLSVDAVICDIEMPRLDGYGVLEEIKERSQFTNLPIAMLTSRSNEKHRKLAMNLGAAAYFSKPYNEQELLDKLAELLRMRG
jgi:chemotaxis protein histidine kinase CheA/ActR/RegA family two-component response regulator